MTLSASTLVNVVPGVIGAGANAVQTIGLYLDNNSATAWRVPLGTVQSFANATAVADYFGATSPEYAQAQIYFGGTTISDSVPTEMLVAQCNISAVSAYVRGGAVTSLSYPLSYTGSLAMTVAIDGNNFSISTASGLSLSGVASAAGVAAAMQSALQAAAPTLFEATASLTSGSATLTVSSVGTGGTLSVGQGINGTGIAAGTTISEMLTGSGGAGTYLLSTTATQTVAGGSMNMTQDPPTVTYDPLFGAYIIMSGSSGNQSSVAMPSGSLANKLALSAAGGAVGSSGAVGMNPSSLMQAITTLNPNWTCFTSINELGVANKQAFAQWTNSQNNNCEFVCWSTESALLTPQETTSSFNEAGVGIFSAGYSGTVPIYAPVNQASAASLYMAWAASLNFEQQNGRQTAAFRSQAGLSADVTSQAVANALLANGPVPGQVAINYIGQFGAQANEFTFFYPGSISGPFVFADAHLNQIWLNNLFQQTMLNLLATMPSIPYNWTGCEIVYNALVGLSGTATTGQGAQNGAGPVQQALYFGAIQPGVNLSSVQAQDLISAAGNQNAPQILYNQGYLLQVRVPAASVRATRGSFAINFWYCDGGSVQQLSLSSVEVQ